MDSNIIDIYYQRKKNNITEYTKILMKIALDKKYMNVKLFQDIIEEFIDDDLKNKLQVTYKVNKFLDENNITNLKLKRIINYTINFIDDDKVIKDIYENNDYIILISKIILFSIEINNKTNVIVNPKIRHTNILNIILQENENIYESEFINIVIAASVEMNEKIKENISDDKKFFKTIKDDRFDLNFTQIDSVFYNVNLHYDIKALKKYLITDVEEQIVNKKINYDFTIIIAELLSIYILKLLLKGKKKVKFFIKLPQDFISNIDFLDKLIWQLNNSKIKERVGLSIDYRSLIKYNEIVEGLKNIGFKIAIYDMNKLNHNTYLFNDIVDYIFINNKLKDTSKDVFDFCTDNNLILFDDSIDLKENIKEDYLLKH